MASLGADVAVFDASGKILLTLRNNLPVWCLPGGHVEDGESIAQAAIREVYEETGLMVRLTRLVGLYSRPLWVKGAHVVVFEALSVEGALNPQETEVTDAQWFAPDQLPREILWWHRCYIEDAIKGSTVSTVKQLDQRWPIGPGMPHRLSRVIDAPESEELIASLYSPPYEGAITAEVGSVG